MCSHSCMCVYVCMCDCGRIQIISKWVQGCIHLHILRVSTSVTKVNTCNKYNVFQFDVYWIFHMFLFQNWQLARTLHLFLAFFLCSFFFFFSGTLCHPSQRRSVLWWWRLSLMGSWSLLTRCFEKTKKSCVSRAPLICETGGRWKLQMAWWCVFFFAPSRAISMEHFGTPTTR